jgi:hypothetical protein
VVLAGAHVAPDRDVERHEASAPERRTFLELGEAVQHPQVDIVGVGLGDLPGAELVIGEARIDLEPLQLDGRTSPRGSSNVTVSGNCGLLLVVGRMRRSHQVSMPDKARLRRRARRVPSIMALEQVGRVVHDLVRL